MTYLCPICKNVLPLNAWGNAYRCDSNHSFDIAKEGYVNLLPVQKKHSKDPGDSKEMIRARHDFLAAGLYDQMAETLADTIKSATESIIDSSTEESTPSSVSKRILDLGCGEGFYSRKLEELLNDEAVEIHGLDIAKNAIVLAAKKQKKAKFLVASSNELPFPDDFFDLVYRVYAPSNDKELLRVLKPTGYLLMVTPGPRHLWQLKEMIYDEVREHKAELETPVGFKQISSIQKSYTITPEQPSRVALLQMTPLAWQATEEKRQAIYDKGDFEIEVDFTFTLYQVNEPSLVSE